MDDIVKQALVKWPNVPHCYGWLGLDARGNWYLRDDRAQAAGNFGGGTPHSKGSLLRHEKLIDFIHRNYESDDEGQWFFQNGPQRVYVELECTPWIWRLDGDFNVSAHTGRPASAQQCLLDAQGRVYLQTDLGLGLVHTQDVGHAAEAVEVGLWVPEDVLVEALPDRYHFKRSPATLHGVSR